MTRGSRFIRCGLMPATSLAALMAALPAIAQQTLPAAQPAVVAGPSSPSTLSMLEAMVASRVITQDQADKIIADARARDAAKGIAQAAPQTVPAATSSGAAGSKTSDGAVRVQYVPKLVRDQIKDEVKQEVMAQAKDEGWAAPGQIPDWTRRVRITGDVRFRSEEDMFPKNTPQGTYDQINWAALNARSTPLDLASLTAGTSSNAFVYNNWDQGREKERLRARLGIEADIGDDFSSGIRLASGESSSPVSTNQTLGNSGGNFSKYQLWLDRAFIKYEPFHSDAYGFSAVVGRFANPFFSTELVWSDNLNFDGAALSGKYRIAKGVTPFITIGAFPVYNTDFNFSTYSENKASGQDKWLYAAQSGTDWKAANNTSIKVGAAYYYFNNIEGRQDDCNFADLTCGSDLFRPTFAQHGNTYMPLRNNIGRALATDARYQYFGLASGFHELALTGRTDYDGLKPVFPDQALRVSVDGEFVKNLAFNKNSIAAKSTIDGVVLNNRADDTFKGGDVGYLARLTVGTPELAKRWDWNVSLAYKYIESDAVVDAFTDSDFGMGGTNLKGYVLGANLALSKNVWTTLKWMSADSISGAPYANDVVFLDINAKF